MARLPTTVENGGAQDGIRHSADFSTWGSIARQTHMAAYKRSPEIRERGRDVLATLPGIPANYGARRRGGKNKSAKVDVIEIAIGHFPYLIRKSGGRQRGNATVPKYIPRPIDLARVDYVMGDVSSTIGSSIDEVFGYWDIWDSSWSDTIKEEFRAEDNHAQEAFSESGVLGADEMVEVQSLREYSDLLIGRRQDALESFIQIHERKGVIDNRGISTMRQIYAKEK